MRDDLLRFWSRGYTPQNSALVVSGDIDAARLRELAQRYFGAWSGSVQRTALPPVPAPGERRILIIDRGASPQTALRLGMRGVPRATPDYAALEVMNNALGGIFASRINLNLREEHGYTYGAGSAFQFRRGPGPFLIAAGVRSDVTAPSVHEIFREIDRMRAEPLTAQELDLARDAFARSLPGDFETTEESARSIGRLFVYALPLDEYTTLPRRIEAVTSADVLRVARQYIDPKQLVVVAVGDRAHIEPELEKLALGPVEVRPAE